MGFLIRTKSNQEKSQVCEYLRTKGLSQRISPFRSRGSSFNTQCVFVDHFYGCHWEDTEAFMEGEEMLEVRSFQELKKALEG